MRFAAVLLVAIVCSETFASDPGQPLDCSDWVFVEPGHACVPWVPWPCDPHLNPRCDAPGRVAVMDNQSREFRVRDVPLPDLPDCSRNRVEISLWDGVSERVIAYLDARCDGLARKDEAANDSVQATFDQTRGALLIPLASYCNAGQPPLCAYATRGEPNRWVAAITGFATTFEVLQTYAPPSALTFRVPYMPEGMAAADRFDTYWGPLAHPINVTQAHPLQCGYPMTPPHVGDYETVADTVPTPAPGQGVYYVTAATYQGATRYGRKTTAGHLSGRDPAMLPVCKAK